MTLLRVLYGLAGCAVLAAGFVVAYHADNWVFVMAAAGSISCGFRMLDDLRT